MTGPGFWSSAAANAIGSIVGVVVGVPIALWIERRRRRRDEASVLNHRATEAQEAKERLWVRRLTLLDLLARNVKSNLNAVLRAEDEVGFNRPVYRTDLDLQTWDALKPAFTELVADPSFVGRVAAFFALLHEFAAMLDRRAILSPEVVGFDMIRNELLRLAPDLRHDGNVLLDDLLKQS